jgi:hypothetical protein
MCLKFENFTLHVYVENYNQYNLANKGGLLINVVFLGEFLQPGEKKKSVGESNKGTFGI